MAVTPLKLREAVALLHGEMILTDAEADAAEKRITAKADYAVPVIHACLCEQANHDGAMGSRKIEGHCDHPFGKEFPVSDTRIVNTIFGQFVMCRQCADSLPVEYLR